MPVQPSSAAPASPASSSTDPAGAANPHDENQLIVERRAKLAALREAGIAFPNDVKPTHRAEALFAQYDGLTREQLSVREYMSLILRQLNEAGLREFTELFDTTRGAPILVVTFIALLELVRESLVEITQSECFAPIYVKLANAQSH